MWPKGLVCHDSHEHSLSAFSPWVPGCSPTWRKRAEAGVETRPGQVTSNLKLPTLRKRVQLLPSMTPALDTTSHELYQLPDNRTLAYAVYGAPTGDPVVVHHGTPGSRLFGALLAEAAAERDLQLIVPDRPGYGESSPPPADWGWADWQADLTALLTGLSIDQAGIMGFSGGGPFALAAGQCDWATEVALISSVIPPAETPLTKVAKVPGALRLLFRVSGWLATLRGPESVVAQYTDRAVSERITENVAADFHEALRQGASAVARENRAFGSERIDPETLSVPVRAWHGSDDTNTPLGPVRTFVEAAGGDLQTAQSDHLGTLLDDTKEVFEWLKSE